MMESLQGSWMVQETCKLKFDVKIYSSYFYILHQMWQIWTTMLQTQPNVWDAFLIFSKVKRGCFITPDEFRRYSREVGQSFRRRLSVTSSSSSSGPSYSPSLESASSPGYLSPSGSYINDSMHSSSAVELASLETSFDPSLPTQPSIMASGVSQSSPHL